MIPGISKVYAGGDVIARIYAGSDIVYEQGESGDPLIERIIRENVYVKTYIQTYPHLRQRIYEWPNLLFSLATDKPYMSTLENGGTGYFLLPIRTGVSNVDITLLYKAVAGKYARIYGSRTGAVAGDDTWTFINENQRVYNRLGSYSGTLATLTVGNNYIIGATKNWSSSTAGSISVTVDGTTHSNSGSNAVFDSGLEPQVLFGLRTGVGYMNVSDIADVLYISKVIYANTYEYVPFDDNKLLDIRNNTVLSPAADGFTWHLFSTSLKTEISNPDISLLIS